MKWGSRYTYINNMAFSYVNIFMIIIAIILVALLLLIYFLMKKKEKKVLFYLLATIYYFISFILYIYFISIFNSLEFTVYNNQSLVLFRDIRLNMLAKFGTITTIICKNAPTKKLPIKYLFSNIPILKIDSSVFMLKL